MVTLILNNVFNVQSSSHNFIIFENSFLRHKVALVPFQRLFCLIFNIPKVFHMTGTKEFLRDLKWLRLYYCLQGVPDSPPHHLRMVLSS